MTHPATQLSSYIVVQALDDLDAVVAEIELPEVHQALQALDLGQPVALQGELEWRETGVLLGAGRRTQGS